MEDANKLGWGEGGSEWAVNSGPIRWTGLKGLGVPVGKGNPHPVSHEVLWDDGDGLEMVFRHMQVANFLSGWPLEGGCRVECLGLALALVLAWAQ